MIRRPPIAKRTDTRFPSTTLCRSSTQVEERSEEDHRKDRVRSVVEWVTVIVGALVVALVVKTFLIQAFYIPSESMEPTLDVGDRVLVNKLSYDLHDINRGDIVVFELPEDQVGPDGIKDITTSEEHTSELQSLMRISYAVFCLKKKNKNET